MKSSDGEIVAEVRERAGQISRRYNDDVRAYAEHLKEMQKRLAGRLVSQVTVVPGEPDDGAKPTRKRSEH